MIFRRLTDLADVTCAHCAQGIRAGHAHLNLGGLPFAVFYCGQCARLRGLRTVVVPAPFTILRCVNCTGHPLAHEALVDVEAVPFAAVYCGSCAAAHLRPPLRGLSEILAGLRPSTPERGAA